LLGCSKRTAAFSAALYAAAAAAAPESHPRVGCVAQVPLFPAVAESVLGSLNWMNSFGKC